MSKVLCKTTTKKKFNLWRFTKWKCSSIISSPSPFPKNQHHRNQIYSSSSSSTSTSVSNSKSHNQHLFSSSEDYSESSPPDLSTLLSTQRFFFSFPGSSKSILESSLDIFPSLPESDGVLAGGVAVSRYSPDPYMEFRRSMQEMVEARDGGFKDVEECWDYLHKLLLCYLSLNPRSTHNLIVRAFSDLVVSFM